MSTTSNFSDEHSSYPPLSPLQSPPSSINRSQSYPTLSSSLAAPPQLSRSNSAYIPRSGIIVKSNGLNVNAVAFYPRAFYQEFFNEIYPEFYFEHPIYEAEVSPNFTYQETFAPPGCLPQNVGFAMETGGDCIPHTLNEEEEIQIDREMKEILDSATHEQHEFYENSVDSPGYIPQKVRFANQTGIDYIPNQLLINEEEENNIMKNMSEFFESRNKNSITYEQYAWMWNEALQNAKGQNSIAAAQYAQEWNEAYQNARNQNYISTAQYAQEWNEALQNAKN